MIAVLIGTALYTGGWRNWRKYHTTLMYWIICTLLYEVLTYTYPLWVYRPDILINHTITSLFVIFIIYPVALYLYLPYFPRKRMLFKVLYVMSWVIFASVMEWVYSDHFLYRNGWNLKWSFVLNMLMFSMLKLHYHKPLLTYSLSIITIIGFLFIFQVPMLEMK